MTRETITLLRGESRLLRAPAGSRWHATCGRVRFAEPPRWLGERIVQVDALLRGSEVHALDAGGWITLHALANCTIEHEAPASTRASWGTRWRIIRWPRALRHA